MPQPLRIGVDAHAIGNRQTGNERYLANLIRGLRPICDHELVLFFSNPQAAEDWPRDDRTAVRVMRPGHAAARLLWHLPRGARNERLDALLVQYVAPRRTSCPVATIVHDVAFTVYPEHLGLLERAWTDRIPPTMRRSAAIVTVSEFSRSEIARLHGIDPQRIVVAPNAVAEEFDVAGPSEDPPIPPPYLLTIGNLQPRKNIVTLVRAFREALRRQPSLPDRLVVVGQPGRHADAIAETAGDLLGSGRVLLTGYLPDTALVALLRSATAFAYPSVYEGFGLPVIEAMACGAPVLASDIPVMHEVTGGAGMLVPPMDVTAWADAMLVVALRPDVRNRLSERGRERAGRYTPQACATPVLETLERIAHEPGVSDGPGRTVD